MFAAIESGTARTPWGFDQTTGAASYLGNDDEQRISERHLMHHLDVMTRGFQVETRTRIPAKKLHVRLTRIDASPSASARATAVLAAWDGFPAVSRASAGHAHVVMNGHVGNAREMRELYALPPAEPTGPHFIAKMDGSIVPPPPSPPPSHEGAALILALYAKRFEDKDGDPSDQPSTALTACEGSFSFVLIDEEKDVVLVARSAESDTHPMFWGTAPSNGGEDGTSTDASHASDDWDGALLLSNDLAAIDVACGGAAAAFPLGAYYYRDASMDVGVIQRLAVNCRGVKRRVNPLHRVNSSGQVCGLGFFTESGSDLASLSHKFIT